MSSSLYGRNQSLSARHAAARSLAEVIAGRSLNQIMPATESRVGEEDRSFYRELTQGTCRWYFRLNALAKMLLKQPFGDEDQDLHALLLIGLYQLNIQGKAPHAAVHATVDVCEELGKGYAKPVINACLRRYGREYETLLPPLEENPVTATSHPKWLVKLLTKAWPEHWQTILAADNERAPMTLRVNRRHGSRDEYLDRLQQAGIAAHAAPFGADAVVLEQPCDVNLLPGFADGHVSVQDEAAQLAASLLAPQDGEHILDACAAPGGKSGHLLEAADIHLTAADVDETRLLRISENLARLQLQADVVCADITEAHEEWQKPLFDAILLDVPCSATGVIRRHPDIRLLRRREDIDQLTQLQADILKRAWSWLKPGGRLLYATCSVLPQENSLQVEAFLATQADARENVLHADWGIACTAGRQLFPQTGGHDGFYYALLHKASEHKV